MTFAEMTGAHVYCVHTSCDEALRAAQAAQYRGVHAWVESVIPHFLLDDSYAQRPDFEGAKFVMSPPLRPKKHQPILWDALRSGLVSTVATDHAPFDFEGQKDMGHPARGSDFTKIPNGIPSIEDRVNLLYTYGVCEGRIDLHTFVAAASTNTARLFGLTGKGTIALGADADLVVYDPDYRGTISAKTQAMNVDYSGFEGYEIKGRPSVVAVRGHVQVRDGEFVGEQTRGKLAKSPAQSTPLAHRRYAGLAHAALIVACALLIAGTLDDGHHFGGDFAAYIMQAQSLIDGDVSEYMEANAFTVNHSSRPMGPVTYPWGVPVLLAPVLVLFGMNLYALKAVGAAAYVLFLALLPIGFRRWHTPGWLLCLTGLFALNPFLIGYANHIVSDLPFLLVSTAAVLWIDRWATRGESLIGPRWDPAMLGALIALACMLRTTGLLLLAALAATQAAGLVRRTPTAPAGSRPRRVWLLLLPYAVFFVLTVVWRSVLPYDGASYVDQLEQITAGSVKYHVEYYAVLFADFFLGLPLYRLIYLLSVPFVLLGAWRRRGESTAAIIYIALTIGLYIVWPSVQGLRFVFPLLPFYISFMLTGLAIAAGEGRTGGWDARRIVSAAAAIVVIVGFAVVSVRTAGANLADDRVKSWGPYTAEATEMLSFVREKTPEDGTIAFFRPRIMRLMTGRAALGLHTVEELGPADYLCIHTKRRANQIPTDRLDDLVAAGSAEVAFENELFRVYRLSRE
jgi:hypothetical protein